MARRVPVKTALVGLLFAPGAMAQQPPDQNAQAPDPTPPPTENKPGRSQRRAGHHAARHRDRLAAERRLPDQQGLDQPPGRRRPDGRAAVGDRHQQGADAVAGRDLAAPARSATCPASPSAPPRAARSATTSTSTASRRAPTSISTACATAASTIATSSRSTRSKSCSGPSSMLFGRGSTGGVINQVMKKPALKKATELSVSGTTNGLVRGTADVNMPFGEDSTSAARVNAMFQYGKASTLRPDRRPRISASRRRVKLGIGTPTEVTLQALLQHNHDQIAYGVPPLNGFPLNVPRNTAYGFDRRLHQPGRHLARSPRSTISSTRTSSCATRRSSTT